MDSTTVHTPDEKVINHPGLNDLDELCINTIRTLTMDAVQKAKSGHPGMPMGMAPAAYILWTRHLRYNPHNPKWVNRDRFVLSAGHGCMLLYSLLHLTGYDLSLDDLKSFRQWGSKTPGHPEYGHTPGVEVTTGPLGQGISNSVGMAIAEKYLAAYFNRDGLPLIDYKIYVIAGDGDMQEGVASEASSLAGHLGLNNLIVIYDDNRISIDGSTSLSFSEDVAMRYQAYGWFVQSVGGDGNDMVAFEEALKTARNEKDRPCMIKLRTHIAYGSPNKQDTKEAHGSPLGDEEVALTKKRLGWDPAKTFFIPDEALKVFREQAELGAEREKEWNTLFEKYAQAYPDKAREFKTAAARKLPDNWESIWSESMSTLKFDPATQLATREAQGKVLGALMPKLPLVLGGSADLTPSNDTWFKGATDFSSTNRVGRYIRYGVREHGMGAVMNGIAVSDMLIPYGATFFAFTDYMRPPIRLAALSKYPTIFVYTHESIGLGEDGPTHQAVEHFASFRAMPGIIVIRPADANETAWAWKFALEHRQGPVMLATTRQKLPVLDQTKYPSAANLYKGAYVLVSAPQPRVLLISTGSEVQLALKAYAQLEKEGVPARVISMPSWELFDAQPKEYREQVIPPSVQARVGIEAGVEMGWEKYLGPKGQFIGMSTFGSSAPVTVIFDKFGFTVDRVVDAARKAMS